MRKSRIAFKILTGDLHKKAYRKLDQSTFGLTSNRLQTEVFEHSVQFRSDVWTARRVLHSLLVFRSDLSLQIRG
jgi:hypothetical protein